MPTYEYKCKKCKRTWDKFLTFAEFDLYKDNITCDKCGMKANLTITCPHTHVVNVTSIGLYAEKNTKKIGKTKIEELEAKKLEAENKGKKPVKGRWWGKLDVNKQKDLLKDNSPETIKKREKYIQNGD